MVNLLKKPNLKIDINGFVLKNPIMTASGTFGYADEFDDYMDVENIGAVVTKAISLLSREGNNNDRIFEVENGLINSIGLENVGVKRFFEEKYKILKQKNIEFVINLAGSCFEEYIELAKICQKEAVRAIELNVSCPNVKSGCLEFGTDEKILYKLVSVIRQEFQGSLIVKLTPNVTSIEKMGVAAQNAGADAVSAINTVRAMGIDLKCYKGSFTVQRRLQGGFSGSAIKPIALSAVYRLAQSIDIPIIGIGGISCLQDVLEFFTVGAKAVQIGTANFVHPNISEKIVNELSDFMSDNGFCTIDDLQNKLRGALND